MILLMLFYLIDVKGVEVIITRKHSRVVVISCLSLMLLLNPLSVGTAAKDEKSYRFDEVLSLLSNMHISGMTEDKLIDAAINGMINSLDDPYTDYFNAAKAVDYQNAVNGQRVGLGVSLATNDKGIYVNQVFPATPAEQSGIRPGDYLIGMNGGPIITRSMTEVSKAFSNKKEGDTIQLTVQRGAEQLSVNLTFKAIQYPVITYSLFGNQIGYIRLYTFSWNAELEFKKALDDLKSRGMAALIIDLRDNGGGYVESARQLAGHFIKSGTFMYEQKRDTAEKQALQITEGSSFPLPVSVLINEHTASASEMFAGFMQDHKLATLIGTRSFGKGVAQQVTPLISGGTLKVTNTEWLTPNKTKVNKIGIQPQIEVSGQVEPLIRALLRLNTQQIELELNETYLRLNQIELPVYVPFIEKKEGVYVPARLLAAIAGAEIQWNQSNSSVTITTGTGVITYQVSPEESRETYLKDGICFIHLAEFQKKLPGLVWKQKVMV